MFLVIIKQNRLYLCRDPHWCQTQSLLSTNAVSNKCQESQKCPSYKMVVGYDYPILLKTGSLDNEIREFSLA